MLSALSQRRTLSPQPCISSHKMSEQSNKRAKPLSVPAQDFPFVRVESRFSCCQLEGCPLMYDRAILLMSKARQRGFLAFVSLSLGPDQLEAAHWPKEIRSGLQRLWCCTEWTNFWWFACLNAFWGSCLARSYWFLTQVFGDEYMHFLPDICAIDTCFKTTDTVDWLGEKMWKREVGGWNQLWNKPDKWSFCLGAKTGILFRETNKQNEWNENVCLFVSLENEHSDCANYIIFLCLVTNEMVSDINPQDCC